MLDSLLIDSLAVIMKKVGIKDSEYIMNGGISSTEEYTKSLKLKLSPEVINQIKD
ncbi:MAG: hypothetical protein NY202_03875 [Mollicutes bacterium UO1]